MSVHSDGIIFYLQTACNVHSNDSVGKATSNILSYLVLGRVALPTYITYIVHSPVDIVCYAAKHAKEFSICYVSFPCVG